MKRSILRFSAFAVLLLPGVVTAVQVDPVMVTLNNPNQIVTAPTSGVTMLDFSGTVFVDQNYHISFVELDFPYNNSQTNHLTGTLNSAFTAFVQAPGNGTYTGSLFELDVPTGTPPDLYAFAFGSTDPSVLFVEAFPLDNVQTFAIDSPNGEVGASDSAAFSVQVNAPTTNGVPDRGSSVLLLGASLVGIVALRRHFFVTG